MTARPTAVEIIAGALVAFGILAYVVIDPYAVPTGDCDDTPAFAPSKCAGGTWKDPGAWQLVLVSGAIVGALMLLVSLGRRVTNRRTQDKLKP